MTTEHTGPLDGATDADLVERYRRDQDTDAFAVLVSRHGRRLWATALRMLRDPQDASDVVQMAWLAAMRALSRPDGFGHRAALSTWLQSIVRNQALDQMRRNRLRAHEALDDHVDEAATGDAFAATDARIVVTQLLGSLPAHQRAAIELVWLRGLSVDEAAAVLGVAPGTVKSRCGRARHLMAAAVGRAGLITTALHDSPPPM